MPGEAPRTELPSQRVVCMLTWFDVGTEIRPRFRPGRFTQSEVMYMWSSYEQVQLYVRSVERVCISQSIVHPGVVSCSSFVQPF